MMEEDRYVGSRVFSNQKRVMYSVAYVDTLVYAALLWLTVRQYETFTRINELILIFGIGALISTVVSFLIIRHASLNKQKFMKTLIFLGIAHVPSVTGFFLSVMFIFSNV